MSTYPNVEPHFLKSLDWRSIGPFRGGRVGAVAGDPVNPSVFYFGGHAGGVWKTTDAGTYWENVSDRFFGTAAVGAVAVAPSDPNVIYAGTGDGCFQHNESHGDGIYRSTDGGKTWRNMGLADTRHIAKIRVHPQDPNLVYVAALGHTWGPNRERGVYRSRDGGENWELVLFKSEDAGAVDLSMDPNNPRILYAALYQLRGLPWTHISGGPDSGLYRSDDGGDTWTELSRNPGLPQGTLGKLGVAVSPAQPGRVWTIIEAEDGGLFRSDDGGDTWTRVNSRHNLWWRSWYYMHLCAHPTESDTCYVLSVEFWKSTDGGSNFESLPTPHGDNHDLWIDPLDPDRMITGNDGGASVSLNGGTTWSTIYNQPTAGFFHLTADNQYPYRLYGTQMDNTAISIPSRGNEGCIPWKDCYAVGSAESGHIAVRPDDPNIVYAGAIGSAPGGGGVLLRYDHHTGQTRIITVWPEDQGISAGKDLKYRFQFHFPTFVSPHDPDTLYVAANVVFRSRDEGTSWEALSPDLTRNDESKMSVPASGPISYQVSVPFNIGSIITMAESIHEEGVLWAGSDDGLVHITRDGGGSWQNITPPDMPYWAHISVIEPSPHEPACAYMSAACWKQDDTTPYLWKTDDYGQTWQMITRGIRDGDFTRVIREDPSRRGLLYAGTETGVYVSFDDGGRWQSLQRNLPAVPVHDAIVQEKDLVIATHGRSFWIMDDLTPLHQMSDQVTGAAAHLFQPRATVKPFPALRPGRPAKAGVNYGRVAGHGVAFKDRRRGDETFERVYLDAGQNPPEGVVVTYYLKDRPKTPVTLSFLAEDGTVIREFTSGSGPAGVTAEAGMNRFVWDTRYPGVRGVTPLPGPRAVPDTYRVQLKAAGHTFEQSFTLLKDPRVKAKQGDLQAQLDLLQQIAAKLAETNTAVGRLRQVRQQIDEWAARARGHEGEDQVAEAAAAVKARLGAVEEELVTVMGPNPQQPPPARLSDKLVSLTSVVGSADWVPTTQSQEVFQQVSERLDVQLDKLRQVFETDVGSFVKLVESLDIPAITS